MPFCNYSREFSNNGYTPVENSFINSYMPDAPPKCAEVYLFGLFLCTASTDYNSIDTMCLALSMEEDDILTAFTYWEELGLVQVLSRTPFEVIYLPITADTALLKKIKPGKYKKFNTEIQNVLNSRMINPNEYNEYHLFLETNRFQPEALVRVAAYCVAIKGADVGYSYILTVARNLASGGFRTLEKVEEKLDGHSKYNDDVKLVLKALKLDRKIDFEDRRLFEKWTDGFGFTTDTIVHVAKQVKTGGIRKLDGKLESYYRLKLFSQKEIAAYEKKCEQLYNLAVEINKIMGLYYSSLDFIVEEYVSQWLTKGFEEDALKLIAKYCFTRSVRTFEGLNQTVEKFYKLGLVTAAAINQYVNSVTAQDGNIRQILDECGLVRMVSTSDRNMYKTWTKNWALDFELIKYAASLSAAATNPIAYANKVLSEFKAVGITTVEQAKAQEIKSKPQSSAQPGFAQHSYTAEQLNALWDNLDELL